MYYLGLDTSFYTTSLAAVDADGRTLLDLRRVLPVVRGKRGLRPQEAVFFHVTHLAELSGARRGLGGRCAGVAASVRPRPAPESYLPVFRVSEAWGRALAATAGVPFLAATHQDGHLAAGLSSAGFDPGNSPFLAMHLSGGTTELLRVSRTEVGFAEEPLSWTGDLHAGQLVDRIGVALGLPFPAGSHLEELADRGCPGALTIPSAVRDGRLSFSGPEAAALRQIASGAEPADVAVAVFSCIATTLEKVFEWGVHRTGLRDILMVGGVAANKQLRNLTGKEAGEFRLWWSAPRYCTDNALGLALLARARSVGEGS
ncbi:MAG: O-sialoglycoprotein endopeptidase [Actinobacteria bacterium]|nr:O-sialoglycoprotein endopeptidase [Actinomycetota bacterium]